MSKNLNSVVAICIFLFVSINFLFPCNRVFPLDRRTTSIVGAVMCYVSRTGIDNLHAVNFDVMILLSSIMIVNHIVVHLKETKEWIAYIQELVQSNPIRGLWAVSFAAFSISPFLTNDGVCLLFVEPILMAFEHAPFVLNDEKAEDIEHYKGYVKLKKADALYFLLALACSANIGSVLTYTGNPQNMIVSSDAIGVMPSYKFFIYMLPASLFSWVITMKWIERCWLRSRQHMGYSDASAVDDSQTTSPMHPTSISTAATTSTSTTDITTTSRVNEHHLETRELEDDHALPSKVTGSELESRTLLRSAMRNTEWIERIFAGSCNAVPRLFFLQSHKASNGLELVVSPRRKAAHEKMKQNSKQKAVYFIVSPFPYAVPVILGLMIVLIFVNVLPIAGTVCVCAVLMMIVVILGNHLRGQQTWVPILSELSYSSEITPRPQQQQQQQMQQSRRRTLSLDEVLDELGPMTREDEVDNQNLFFESLYSSIDYNLLLIFLGLFIVIENLSFTGIPRYIWSKMVGRQPFHTFISIFGISVFVLAASQLLGNVPVIQLAKPNIEGLNDNTKRLALAILSFVATIGGNLTLTGSAANIIVAEKAARLDSMMAIDFFRHYRVCFWVTLLSCSVGALVIAGIVMIDNARGSPW